MLNKLNTVLRLLVVGLLIYPMPIAMANHIPTQAPYDTNASNNASAGTFTIGILGSDGFEDSPPESYTIFFSQSNGVTETNSFCVTTSFGHSTNTWQYHTFSLDDLKYYFNDPAGTNIYYRVRSNNITDYSFSTLTNQNTWNLYAGTPFDYNQTDWSAPTGDNACDDPKILDGIGDPSNLTTSANLHDGSITIDWDAALDRYEYSAERYAIGFDKADPPMYGIATGNVGDSNALNTEYTFTKSYLEQVLNVTVGDTVYFKIRADNDTNSKYSNWTSIASYTIQDVASGVTNLSISNTEYQGLSFSWTQPNTGWSLVESYRIEYKLSSVETYTGIDIADASATSYTIENISAGTYDFVVYSCTQSGSYCHGGQAGPNTNFEVLNTTAVTTTTTTTIYVAPPPPPPPPPPAPEEIIVDVVIEGVDKTYTQADVNDGTTSRDQERADNEAMYGCFMTNAQIDRGDCFEILTWDEDEIQQEDDDYYDEDVYADDGYLKNPEDADEDLPIYDEEEVVWIEDETIYEVYDEEEGWVEVSEDEFEAYLEYEAEISEKEFEILETYDDEYLEDLNLYIPEEELEGLTDEEILILEEELQKDFEEFVETVLAVEEYLEELEEYEQEVILIEVIEFEDVVIVFEEEFPEDFPEEEVFVEELQEEEIEILTEQEYEEYKEERKEVIETYVDDLEEEILEDILPETITVQDFEDIKEKDIEELTKEEVEIVVEVAAEVIEEVVDIEKLEEVIVAEDIIVLDEEELEELSEEELVTYEEEIDEVITEYVQELATEELVVVVEQVADVGVENLASADKQTVKVIQAVVTEVVNVETVQELSVEEVEAVGELLGFTEEEAAEDVQIIAEQAATDENVAEAVEEFVERAVEAAEDNTSQPYTIADAVTEVQTEQFLQDPIGQLIDIDLSDISVSNVGDDMTSDQKEKAQEVVVPVIIVAQIAAMSSVIPVRRLG